MVGFVLSVAQKKGGVGKSTLAAQLAVACAGQGYLVKMIDLDQQGSLVTWAALRAGLKGGPADQIDVQAGSAWRLPFILERLTHESDIVIIDGASNRDDDFAAMAGAADLILIPCQPTSFDLWATKVLLSDTPEIAGRALVVLNRMPPKGKAAALIRHEVKRLGWPLADQLIGNRQAYVHAISMGQGVTETAPNSQAAEEIQILALDVLNRMPGGRMVA